MINDTNVPVDDASKAFQTHELPIEMANTRVIPNADVHCTVLEGEAVLLHLKSGHYYTLNRVGTVAWEQFTDKSTLKEVYDVICSRFEVSEQQAMTDLMALVNHLDQEGLIQQERG